MPAAYLICKSFLTLPKKGCGWEDQEWWLGYERFNGGSPAYCAIAVPGRNEDNFLAARFRRLVIREALKLRKDRFNEETVLCII